VFRLERGFRFERFDVEGLAVYPLHVSSSSSQPQAAAVTTDCILLLI